MKKYILSAVIALFYVLTNTAFSQGFTVLDTVKYKGKAFQMVSVPLDELDITPERDNYPKLVIRAMEMGLALCPTDSTFLDRVSRKVSLDPDHHKFQVLVATVPYTGEMLGGENEFFIPTIISLSGNRKAVELYDEIVGIFNLKEFPDPFPPIYEVNSLGYWGNEGFTPYDWVFLRVIPQVKS